jgi:ABC-2 type transport system ATP-binding protein
MSDDFVIETRDLGKRYGERIVAVDQLVMRVRRGEVYGFLGPNGAGKTTTLRMLLGLIRPTSGSALVLGSAPGSSHGLARIGALIETPTFYPFLSGRDNLRVVARYAGVAESRIEPALAEVKLAGRADDRFRTYSLGMKQRLGIAAALLKDPELLILDEPANALDPAGIKEVRNLLRRLGDEGRTVFVSSHLLSEVQQMCDRVAILNRGRAVASGPVGEVLARGRTARLVVRVSDLERGHAVLRTAGFDASRDGGRLLISLPAAEAAHVTETLAREGLFLSELRPEEVSLEDVFLELTGEEVAGEAP